MTFLAYIWCFVHNFHLTLWPWTSTFWPWGVWWIKRLTHQTHIPILASSDYPFLSYMWLNLITLPSLERSLRMRRVMWSITGGKNDPHFWNPWLQFSYSLRHFPGGTTKIKPCYRRKIVFSHCEGYKVYCACAVSRDLCIGGPPSHT